MQRARFGAGDQGSYNSYEHVPYAWWKLLAGLLTVVVLEAGFFWIMRIIAEAGMNVEYGHQLFVLLTGFVFVVGNLAIGAYVFSGARREFLVNFWDTRLRGVLLRFVQIEGSNQKWTCFVVDSPESGIRLVEGEQVKNGIEIEVHIAPWPIRRKGRVLKDGRDQYTFADVRLEKWFSFYRLKAVLFYDDGCYRESMGPLYMEDLFDHVGLLFENSRTRHSSFSQELIRLEHEMIDRELQIEMLTAERESLARELEEARELLNDYEKEFKCIEREERQQREVWNTLQQAHELSVQEKLFLEEKLRKVQERLELLIAFFQHESTRFVVESKEGARSYRLAADVLVELSRDREQSPSIKALHVHDDALHASQKVSRSTRTRRGARKSPQTESSQVGQT